MLKTVTGTLKRKFRFNRMLAFAMCLPVMLALGLTQSDLVYAALNATETTETLVGTITVPTAGVKRIVGVYGMIQQPTATAGEVASGNFRLAFKTVSGSFKFPAHVVYGPAGTLAANANQVKPQIIPVNIPVPPNESIACYATGNIALTGTCTAQIGVIFE